MQLGRLTKKQRQAITAGQTKCVCGNVASYGHSDCSRCRQKQEDRIQEWNKVNHYTQILQSQLCDVVPNSDTLTDVIVMLIESIIEREKHK
jgi:uncharacterized OB-fold protein